MTAEKKEVSLIVTRRLSLRGEKKKKEKTP